MIKTLTNETGSSNGEELAALAALLLIVASWGTHVVDCIQDGQWVLLFAGILAAPVGWLHGVGLWFGWF